MCISSHFHIYINRERADPNTKSTNEDQKTELRHNPEHNVGVMKIFNRMHNTFSNIPSKLYNYVNALTFATSLKENHSTASESQLRDYCQSRYSSCKYATLQMP